MNDSFDRILTSVPINKTAAVVAKGTNTNPELTPEQKRENLLPLLAKLERAIATAKTPEDRKKFGLMKSRVQEEIRALRPKLAYPRDFGNFFMDAAKDILPAATFAIIRNEAVRLMKRPTGEDAA